MKRNGGFTMVELMIVIAIVAVAITLAVPSFRDLIERKAVGGAAEAAYEQLQQARSQAVKRSKPIVVDFYTNGTNWAIGFTDDKGGCDANSTDCTVDEDNIASNGSPQLLMRIAGSDYKNITMSSAAAFSGTPGGCTTTNPEEACFDFVRGLARVGAYNFASTNYELRVQVDQLGHVTICNSGEKYIVGYDDC